MAKVSTYLNFEGKTEEAFNFYKNVFKTEFAGGIMRFKDVPPIEGMPQIPEKEKDYIMHIELPISGGHVLMGSDTSDTLCMGVPFVGGNNFHINLQPDNESEGKTLFDALSEGGKITMPFEKQFWGDHYGSFTDKYGVNWMVNVSAN